jgi:hypothetical protein
VRKADNLSPSSADVTGSGSLNLPEPSGPHRSVMGIFDLTVTSFIQQLPHATLALHCTRQAADSLTHCLSVSTVTRTARRNRPVKPIFVSVRYFVGISRHIVT